MNFKLLIRKKGNNKIAFLSKVFKSTDSFAILDVGSGNGSATKIKSVFPKCKYYGLDLDRSTNYSAEDFQLMEEFYELDLTKLNYNKIPNDYFDYINMAHVIEHLENGDLVLEKLIEKLKPNGYFYIEYPGSKSLKLPSMKGTLNFYDDPTHVRVYSIPELSNVFQNSGLKVIKAGTRRNWFCILATPFRLVVSLFKLRMPSANIFWDLLGFAEFLFAQKN